MIEKTFRGVSPNGTITAPTAPVDQWRDYTDEELRLRTFLQSHNTRAGKVAPFPADMNSPPISDLH